jgi:propionate CoA-transferase
MPGGCKREQVWFKITGCGGFIDISQSSKKVVYCGSFTAGGLEVQIRDGKLKILKEGKVKKFKKEIMQVTFSGTMQQNVVIRFYINRKGGLELMRKVSN